MSGALGHYSGSVTCVLAILPSLVVVVGDGFVVHYRVGSDAAIVVDDDVVMLLIAPLDAFDDRWVREAQGKLERAQAEIQATTMDVSMRRGLDHALVEVSCLLETEPFQATERAQNVESAPPDTTITSGTRRRDNLAKVMFNERQRKNARVVFGDEDAADKSFDSD
ncbi:hypothetical protein L7F22_014937 [Adiantum nelumboides]|nr:hypothetical protein [Adiantum nelumboides]